MEKTTRLPVAATLLAGLVLRAGGALAQTDDELPRPMSLANAVASSPIPVERTTVRFVIDPPRQRLGLEGAAFGATFGGLLVGIPAVIGGGDSGAFQLTLVSAGLGAVAGGLAGALQPRGRGEADLMRGDKLRVVSDGTIVGTFEGVTDVGVVLRLASGEERVVPYLDALEVRRSTRLTRVGAVVGGTMTLAGLLLIHAVLCEGECSDGPSAVAYAFVGGGAIVGAGLGALVQAHDWRQVRPEGPGGSGVFARRQVSFHLAPATGKGVRGQLSIRWR